MLFNDFRLFYNQVIHPELLNMERRRVRLVRLLSLSVFLLFGIFCLQVYIKIFLVTLLLLIPVGCWLAYLVFRVRVYYEEFKPRIVRLILDFIDNDVNYSQLQYSPNGFISKERFLESTIFTRADDYVGEDLITGQVRETPFSLCELRVSEFSDVRNKLDQVFKGVFLTGDFHNLNMEGSLLVLPDKYMKYLSRSERAFHLNHDGRRVHGIFLPEFEPYFNTYASKQVHVKDVLSEDFQKAILEFRRRLQQTNNGKEIYFSIIGDNISFALTQEKDLLEPSLWATNVSYENVQEFYEDITLLLDLVLKVDVMN